MTALAPAHAPHRRRDLLILVVVTVGLLVPFLSKPLHVDDPMYVWAARQIAAHPLDPYGFDVNWNGTVEPMARVMQNPPLVPYYIAAVSRLVGWREVALHAAFLPATVLAAVGTYLLAAEFCRRPLAAALLLVATPAFLVSATTLMCELPLLCLWVWSAHLWVRGSAAEGGGRAWALLLAAGAAAAAAVLVKYPGVNLVPLLVGHAIVCPARRKANRWPQAVAVVVPIVVLVAYDRLAAAKYGVGPLTGAVGFTRSDAARSSTNAAGRVLDNLCFAGGGGLPIAAVAAAAFALTGRRAWRGIGLSIALVLTTVAARLCFTDRPANWGFLAQCGLMATMGIALLGVCAAGMARPGGDGRRGLFLLLWVAGVFVFAAFLNWAINVRSVLPLMPAACILAVRSTDGVQARAPLRVATVAGGVVAVLVAVADARFARAHRDAAAQVCDDFARAARAAGSAPPRLWFAGHWGLQHYMQLGGGLPLDEPNPGTLRDGDWVVLPTDNYAGREPHVPHHRIGRLDLPAGAWLTTMNGDAGGGWYYSPGTRLPFAVGAVPPESFLIDRVDR